MGGLGSGNWDRPARKTTVEESWCLKISEFSHRIYAHSSFVWPTIGNRSSGHRLRYQISIDDGLWTLLLTYGSRNGREVDLEVNLETTPTTFGRDRYWFQFPIVPSNEPCYRRSSKLFLPPGKRGFGCRHCYDLTHQSSQEAHQFQRCFARIGKLEKYLGKLIQDQKDR